MKLTLAALCLLLVTGCTTVSQFTPIDGKAPITSDARFMIGEVTDEAVYVFEDNDAFDIVAEYKRALTTEIVKNGLTGIKGDYVINTRILKYEPGNAGLRWLAPGLAGATVLTVNCKIVHPVDGEVASIDVSRNISAGGGYTIGAYKYVFEDVAKEIVKLIKSKMEK